MRMRYPRHLNIGDAVSLVGSYELVKWCQVFQPGAQRGGAKEEQFPGRRMTVGGAEKSQKCGKYFLQYSTFASDLRCEHGAYICLRSQLRTRLQVRNSGRQTCFLPPGRHLTSLRLCSQQW